MCIRDSINLTVAIHLGALEMADNDVRHMADPVLNLGPHLGGQVVEVRIGRGRAIGYARAITVGNLRWGVSVPPCGAETMIGRSPAMYSM